MDLDKMDSGFANYRRERNRRRMDQGPLRHLGKNAAVLKELEAAEQDDARNQQITREVHEFFADATRTAANIVSKVSEVAETAHEQHVGTEMSEFLADTIRRANEFIHLLHISAAPGLMDTEVQTNLHNIVGEALDQFRSLGTAQVGDKHLGQDPFDEDLEIHGEPQHVAMPQDQGPAAAPVEVEPAEYADDLEHHEPHLAPHHEPHEDHHAHEDHELEQFSVASIDDHLVAEVTGPGQELDQGPSFGEDPIVEWFARISMDTDALKSCLKMLVKSGMMEKDEAQTIYKHAKD